MEIEFFYGSINPIFGFDVGQSQPTFHKVPVNNYLRHAAFCRTEFGSGSASGAELRKRLDPDSKSAKLLYRHG